MLLIIDECILDFWFNKYSNSSNMIVLPLNYFNFALNTSLDMTIFYKALISAQAAEKICIFAITEFQNDYDYKNPNTYSAAGVGVDNGCCGSAGRTTI